jgi:hypothetical protein
MSYFDFHVARELAQKRVGERRRRSEADYRLYWLTYWRTVARQASAPRRKSQVWMRVRRLLGALRRRWPERFQPAARLGEEGRPTYLQTSE